MKVKRLLGLCVYFVSTTLGHAVTPDLDARCVLSSATNGQIVTVHGTVRSEPHDMAFDIPGCDETVLVTFAGYSDSDVDANQLHVDGNMKRFMKYTGSTYSRSKGGGICGQCSKYGDVEAEIMGKLEIAALPPGATKNQMGFMRDASGKFVGIFGWGHPVPFAKFRIIVESVSKVKARKLPRP
jgi:hypothetical protein